MLQDLLRATARHAPDKRLIFYQEDEKITPREVSYLGLFDEAGRLSVKIQLLKGFRAGRPVLIHLQDHWDFILSFWAVVLANGLPVPSSSFSHIDEYRQRHIQHLGTLLQSPLCITRDACLRLFSDVPHQIQLHTIEALQADINGEVQDTKTVLKSLVPLHATPLALLMLTSGSTGNVKAVSITNHQVLSSLRAKLQACDLPKDRPFLNWINLDHVAGLVEIHFQAIYHGVDQIHAPSSYFMASPGRFLDLVSHHRVARTFAPNFFLAKLASSINDQKSYSWDLSSLVALGSGGEANDIATCVKISRLLSQYGAPSNALLPGFGMTETCAGSVYNHDCPTFDLQKGLDFASVGRPAEGIKVRVTKSNRSPGRPYELVETGVHGHLQVRGPVVFKSYYRDKEATSAAFTSDGWFRTGDTAYIDSEGNLHVVGRTKDVININSVKHECDAIHLALEKAVGALINRLIVFPSRSHDTSTEQATVVFVPLEGVNVVEIHNQIIQTCATITFSNAKVFSLPSEEMLPTSTLGKISRPKMRELFEALNSIFHPYIVKHQREMEQSQQCLSRATISKAEYAMLSDFVAVLGTEFEELCIDDTIFSIGFTSMDLIQLKKRLDARLSTNVPLVMLLQNTSARLLASATKDLVRSNDPTGRAVSHTSPPCKCKTAYDPVVTLQKEGSNAPLWLVHPGVGEVLVFIQLAEQLISDDRPIHALRARGFEPSDEVFGSLEEVVSTYTAAIQRTQPQGPYAIAGYSYGACIAFEIAKRLPKGQVQFLGSLNLPPHIRFRMQHLNWNLCLLNLACFLGLISEDLAEALEHDGFRELSKRDAVTRFQAFAGKDRLSELALDVDALMKWTDVAAALQGIAADYEPAGIVSFLDVFCAIPLRAVSSSKTEWVVEHLSKWQEFVDSEVRFHNVAGAHYTMLGPQHVAGFAVKLRSALAARGI
ncbi:Aspulvinone E synthetase melA [Paramyrothecium foliicola]|nr:Aspulvinone E synthetase melA [Paramyrothecium foliicola]